MKKLILFFGALCITFSFMGCSGDSKQGEKASNISLTFEGKMDGINKIVTITEGKIKCIFE